MLRVCFEGREALRRIMSATLDTHRTGKGAFESTEAFMTAVGRVVALWRYPVKSMAAEQLDGAEVSWHGLAGDRRWAFIRDGQVRSGFPWLTIRERPELAHYRPFFAEPARPNASATVVRTPSGVSWTWPTPRSRPSSDRVCASSSRTAGSSTPCPSRC
jgi:hypothetical protein